MRVRILKTGEIAEHNDSYGMRLIEQGRAALYVQAVKAKAPAPADIAEAAKEQPEQSVKPGRKR